MSQETLGAVLRIGIKDILEIEAGRRRLTALRLYELGCALGVPVAYFFEEGEATPAAPVAVSALPAAVLYGPKTVSSALRLLLAVVDLADHEGGIDDDHYRAARSTARAFLAGALTPQASNAGDSGA